MTSFRWCWAAFAYLLLCCVPVSAQLNVLTYRPVDAHYSAALDKLILVNGSPNQLHIYDTAANSDTAVNLSFVPTSLALSVDGRYAAVGHDSGKVTYMDLTAPSGARVFDVAGVDVAELAIVGSYIYVMPRSSSLMRYVSITSGAVASTTFHLYFGSQKISLIPRPDETALYISDGAYLSRYNLTAGVPSPVSASVRPECYYATGSAALAENDRVIAGCGWSYRLLPASDQDLRYRGSLGHGIHGASYSDIRKEIAAIPLSYNEGADAVLDSEVRLYDSAYLNQTGVLALPAFVSGGKSVTGRGRFVFYNNAGTRLTVVQHADPAGGLLNDYGVTTYALDGACTVTLSATSATVAATGAQASVNVSAGNCVWQATSDSAWLRLTGNIRGSGNGRLAYYAQANSTGAARTGKLTISGQTFTVTQAARTGTVSALVALPYQVIDADYSSSLDRMVIVSRAPNELRVYDAANKNEALVVPLPLKASSVAVSADGNYAAVGHDAWVSRVDLKTGTVQHFPVNENVKDVALGSTHLYSTGGGPVRSTDVSSGLQTLSTTGGALRLALGSGGTALFGARSWGEAERYSIASGPAQFTRYSSQYESYSCGNLWPSADGARLITACASALRISDVPSQDFAFNGKLGQLNQLQGVVHVPSRGALYAIPGGTDAWSTNGTEVQRVRYDNLGWESTFPLPNLPVDGATIQGWGRHIFASNDGNTLFLVLSGPGANSTAFAIYSVPLDSQPVCQYTISPSPIIATTSGSPVTVTVDTQTACSWSVTLPTGSSFWANGNSGRGAGSFQLWGRANTGTATVTSTLTIAGQTIEIQQPPPSDCTIQLNPSSIVFNSAGGTASITVTTGAGCGWSAVSGESWAMLQPASGVGPGSVALTVSANNLLQQRSTTIGITGRTVTVQQDPPVPACTTPTITPAGVNLPVNGGSAQFTIAIPAGCPWTTSVSGAWFTASPGSGHGPGIVTVTAGANPSATAPRSGHLTVGGRTAAVTQSWQPATCAIHMLPGMTSLPATGMAGIGTLQLGACPSYKVVSSPPWLQIFPLEGNGPAASITFTIFPNFSLSLRSGLIMFTNGASVSVSQLPATSMADDRLVGHLYFAFLGRYPSQAEVAYHVNQGLRKGLTRADIVMNFFNAIEFNAGGRFVAGLYVGLLNRDAEFGGWLFQRNALVNGKVDQTQIVTNFVESAEWKLRFGAPNETEYIRLLYRYILRREASQPEIEFHLGTLQRGLTRSQMAANFLNVPEFRTGTGPRLSAFLLYACLLGREPTTTEMNAAVAALQAGTTFRTLAEQVLATPEFAAIVN